MKKRHTKVEKLPFRKFLRYSSLNEQIGAIAHIIKRDNLTNVGILLPRNKDVKTVSNLLNNNGINHEAKFYGSTWVDDLDFTSDNPKVMTYHSAKGLQFEAVFLPDISPLSDDEDKNISEQKALYVAMTRTYRYLYVMYTGALPYPLSEVPSNLYSTYEKDTVEDI